MGLSGISGPDRELILCTLEDQKESLRCNLICKSPVCNFEVRSLDGLLHLHGS